MKITILSHDLSSNAAMRAYRLAAAASTFCDVEMIGPVGGEGLWPALPHEMWIRSVQKARFPEFFSSFKQLVEMADGNILIAVKPHLASFGAAILAAEERGTPVILDIDDLDIALAPPSEWRSNPSMTDLSRPGCAIYLSLLTKSVGIASAITVASSALKKEFGGSLIPHGCDTAFFDPQRFNRDEARKIFGFQGNTILFPGAVRPHKGFSVLAQAVDKVPNVHLAVTCQPEDLLEPEWQKYPIDRIPFVPYTSLPKLLMAADVIAIPQLDTQAARCQTPMKIFEAMAMARPIVATSVGDLPEVLGNCGRIVPPGDVNELGKAIFELLQNPNESQLLGKSARHRCAQYYSMQQTAEKLQAVLREIDSKCSTSISLSAPPSHQVPVNHWGALRDVDLPQLSRALDPIEMQRTLQENLPHLQDVALAAIRVTRHKPGRRCVIEYDITSHTADRGTIIGKVRKKQRALSGHLVQESLWNAGFHQQSSDGICVPQPIAMIPELHASLQWKAPGIVATGLMEQSQGPLLAARIAEALHKVHSANVTTERRHTIKEELTILQDRLEKVISLRPDWAHRLREIIEGCAKLGNELSVQKLQGIHRDFYTDQVLIAGDQIYILDFDLYSVGDPALDAGNFLGHIIEQSLRRFGDPHRLSTIELAFENKFLDLSHEVSHPRIRAYTLLTLARHIYLSMLTTGRQKITQALMDLCEQELSSARALI